MNNSPKIAKKVGVSVLSIVLAATLVSCSKGKKDASPSASASVSASASASASKSASKKPVAKPTPKKTQHEPAPIIPTATKPYVQTVTPKPEPTYDAKDQAFEKEFKRQTGLDRKAWDEKVNSDPLTYKRYWAELLDYAKGAFCAYVASGADDYTLTTYLMNEVSYLTDIQNAILAATRKAYGCKP